uniref:Putative secreted protein n=1 Tax=Anopheles darlingi TaxID=43151 RepID=A0A2M4D9V5_ANODA
MAVAALAVAPVAPVVAPAAPAPVREGETIGNTTDCISSELAMAEVFKAAALAASAAACSAATFSFNSRYSGGATHCDSFVLVLW